MKYKNSNKYAFPDKEGRFGEFGGKYVSETLITALEELVKVYAKVKKDKSFQEEVIKDLNDLLAGHHHYILPKDGLKNLVEQKFI